MLNRHVYNTAYWIGQLARLHGESISNNPYYTNSKSFDEWEYGWLAADILILSPAELTPYECGYDMYEEGYCVEDCPFTDVYREEEWYNGFILAMQMDLSYELY